MRNMIFHWLDICIFTVLLSIAISGCGAGGGSEGGVGNTTETFTISGPISDPPMVLAGTQTSVTISIYASGSYIELLKSDSDSFIAIGEMKDDGQNGDRVAGDKVYTIQTMVSELIADNVTYRIKAFNNGEEKTRDIIIPIIKISTPTTDSELNQMVNDLFLKGLETQTLLTTLNTNINSAPQGTIKQVSDNLLNMFREFEGVTNQFIGFELFNLAKKAESINQLLDAFSENPFDSRMDNLRQLVINTGCADQLELENLDPIIKDCARKLLFESGVNPHGEGVQLLKDAQKVTIKQLQSEPVSLIGEGLSQFIDIGFLGSLILKELLGKGVGTVVDWFIDDNNEPSIMIGKVQNGEQFNMPAGTNNFLYSFGGDTQKSVAKDIKILPQQTNTVEFSPGVISSGDTFSPSLPTALIVTSVSSSQIDLSWATSTDDIGVAGYNIYKEGAFLKSVTETYTTDIRLSPSTQYCYTVSAYDAAANESPQSNRVCATTSAIPDTTPPAVPTGLTTIVVYDTQIDLSWNKSADDIDVIGYNVYRDGAFLKSVTTTSASDTDLSPSTQYCYTVSAYDSAWNESLQSIQVCVVTNPTPDLSGTWNGSWASSNGIDSGGLAADLTQNGASITGTANVTGSACGGQNHSVSGSISANTISFGIFDSGIETGTYTATFTSSSMSGTYFIKTGPCVGDTGTFSLTK